MAAFTAIISDAGVASMSALVLRVSHISNGIRWPAVRRTFPSELLVAGETQRRCLIGFDQELAHDRIDVFPVRIMAGGALHFSAAIQVYRIKWRGVPNFSAHARHKAERMVIHRRSMARQIRRRTGGQPETIALYKFNRAVIDCIAQGNAAIVTAQAQLGDVLRLDCSNR